MLKYQIALSLVKGIGPILARNLVAFFGDDIEAIFKENLLSLKKVEGVGEVTAHAIKNAKVLDRAGLECDFIVKNGIQPLFFTDKQFPKRLAQCEDAPIMLYQKGKVNLNALKTVAMVGTRQASDYGRENCRKLVEAIASRHPETVIISGLAYGIDICAHREAIRNSLPTVAVLAHGLDRVYPSMHAKEYLQMQERGAVLTEFMSGTNPDKQNFVRRNRIVAGLCDALVIVESGVKGGALITAELAQSYNRDVLAYPGRNSDEKSAGCNWLIKKNVAALIENLDDLEYTLGWQSTMPHAFQPSLFPIFNSPEEEKIYDVIKADKEVVINIICHKTGFPIHQVSALLLNLEFGGFVRSKPGGLYITV